MQSLDQLFSGTPLPYKYCRIPYPEEPAIVRKKKRLYYVNHVISNLTQCAFKHAGFKQTSKSKFSASWGRQYDNDKFAACKAWQKVNHFCGAWLIGRKDQLHKRLTELKKRVGSAASFYPESYIVPAEKEALKADLHLGRGHTEAMSFYARRSSMICVHVEIGVSESMSVAAPFMKMVGVPSIPF